MIKNLKGLRTIGVGLGFAILPSAFDFLMKVDWTDYVSPTTALAISGLLTVGMRFITNTPVFRSEPVEKIVDLDRSEYAELGDNPNRGD